MGHSLVAGGVKGNRICLSSSVPLADVGTVDELRCCIALLMREPVRLSQSLRQPMKRYHVGRATATSLANNYISEIMS